MYIFICFLRQVGKRIVTFDCFKLGEQDMRMLLVGKWYASGSLHFFLKKSHFVKKKQKTTLLKKKKHFAIYSLQSYIQCTFDSSCDNCMILSFVLYTLLTNFLLRLLKAGIQFWDIIEVSIVISQYLHVYMSVPCNI